MVTKCMVVVQKGACTKVDGACTKVYGAGTFVDGVGKEGLIAKIVDGACTKGGWSQSGWC